MKLVHWGNAWRRESGLITYGRCNAARRLKGYVPPEVGAWDSLYTQTEEPVTCLHCIRIYELHKRESASVVDFWWFRYE